MGPRPSVRPVGATLLLKKSIDKVLGNRVTRVWGSSQNQWFKKKCFNLGEAYIGIISGCDFPPHNQG